MAFLNGNKINCFTLHTNTGSQSKILTTCHQIRPWSAHLHQLTRSICHQDWIEESWRRLCDPGHNQTRISYKINNACVPSQWTTNRTWQHQRRLITTCAPLFHSRYHIHSILSLSFARGRHTGDVKSPSTHAYIAIFKTWPPFRWCPENFVTIPLTVQELLCWQTDTKTVTNTHYWKQYHPSLCYAVQVVTIHNLALALLFIKHRIFNTVIGTE